MVAAVLNLGNCKFDAMGPKRFRLMEEMLLSWRLVDQAITTSDDG